MTTVSFQVGSGQPVLIDFDTAGPLTLAEQIEGALAADGNASADTQILTTSESISTSDPFVLIPATGADTVTGSGSQSVAGGSGGLTYTNNDSGSTVSVALDGGNNNLTFGSGVTATVATGAGNNAITASGSGSFDLGAGTNTIDLTGDTNSGDTVTINGGTEDTVYGGAAALTYNAAPGSSDMIEGGSGTTIVFTDGGSDTITGGSGPAFFSIQGGQTEVTSGTGGSTYVITATAAPSHVTINDFGAADFLDIYGTSSVASIVANGVVENGDLTLTLAAGNTVTLIGVTSVESHIGDPGQGAITVCYVAGTRLVTERGEVAIEHLAVGDTVVTASGGHRPVRWLGTRRVDCARHPDPLSVWPVRIQAGSFADGLPSRDLWVSPGHSIFADGVLIQAQNLVNGATITQVPLAGVQYWHVELDDHDIILAEGLPAESYLDTGNRAAFFNNGATYLEAHPDFEPKHWAETCVPLVFEGPILQNVRARLLERAQTLGFQITSDSGLHIMAAGERIEPLFSNEQRVAFVIPTGRTQIELRCRGFIPIHIDAASRDPRKLGVCVARLQIDGVDLPLDDAVAFERGWHELEVYSPQHRQRWSHESAPLPDGTRLVVIELAARSHCWKHSDAADTANVPAARKRGSH